ncbi:MULTISPECIES: hypothetical protein [Streptomycetaceae]|uniref:Uncharacterized protein n=1 Tax=Streptantibioticus cattleyicolor (strain ATCC 35852 / DSM 46488 / JCM 4925 / NBRC 14057 / NRRL 8057) TaxID=1003195 RepID=F8JRY9_STREN|nr:MULTISPECIES: hypothetical protein [Streptomycetaceae]AEW92899.1 hypothetical protein SCATT_05280 [Streptantibioticus cattleyicolor NRRL 8057 = DSM 46488]MYS57650.1 hypothetical protein [Streptomyces sp. SID5468]CCB73256.1 Gp60 (modular protein) [Streptantibioticus cattleyicolor NRRL 8057 = DSM 46488]
MAAPKAAGTRNASGSTKHAPEQLAARLRELLSSEELAAITQAAELTDPRTGHTQQVTPQQLSGLEKLREPFPASAIGKRPQLNCPDCRRATYKVCDRHERAWCSACKQKISNAHVHLDYVGHAEATDRLLDVDPTWNWEPLAYDENGLPKLDARGGMWMKVTICGVTRLGYGDATGKDMTTTAVKEIIGDGIRNASMRFGVALDLWASTDLHDTEPSPVEEFVARLRTGFNNSVGWLRGARAEAEAADLMDCPVPGGGDWTIGQMIDERIEALLERERSYAERRTQAEADKATAAAQVAAEQGVRRGQSPIPPVVSAPTSRPASEERLGETPEQVAERIRDTAPKKATDVAALTHLLGEAQRAKVDGYPADTGQPTGPTIAQALQQLIDDLNMPPTTARTAATTGRRRHRGAAS